MTSCVVKVGGSLFDLPELGPKLRRWLDTLAARHVLLVPGGGPTADVVRDLDRLHQLGDETAHWLALRSLTVNAHFLAALLPGAAVITDPANGNHEQLAILDAHAFARLDDSRDGHLPHTWGVTSDAIAARVAHLMGARQLILLKSTDIPEQLGCQEAARRGLVDPQFATVVEAADLKVQAINFRNWSP